jgi:hypothetical protein
MNPKAKKYRVELSAPHEREVKMAAAAAGLSVPDYMEQVVRPQVQADLSNRLQGSALASLLPNQ